MIDVDDRDEIERPDDATPEEVEGRDDEAEPQDVEAEPHNDEEAQPQSDEAEPQSDEAEPPDDAVAEEVERRGVPRTTTTGDPDIDVRKPGAGAVIDVDPSSHDEDDVARETEGASRRPGPTGRPGTPEWRRGPAQPSDRPTPADEGEG